MKYNYTMTELEYYIKSYFGIVDEKSLNTIASLFKISTCKKGDFFLKAGSYCNMLGFVEEGLFRIFATNPDKEITQWISTKGYFITDLSSFVFQNTARWNIQALVDCEVFIIEKEDYDNIKNILPEWLQLEKLFITRCFILMEDRIFSLLSLSAEERYNLLFTQNAELFNQVPLNYLASMLGMTAETFSRIRSNKMK
jgi:CRP/FNR family transcriptional regulator, anaerobic regulatory protein